MTRSKVPNQLIHSSSPYLKQHAYNPVQWYPWGKEALRKAREEDKPMIISIGYSSCHWCHVMERESFENQEIARVMNEHFVCIKVDREERPDVDQIYMEAVQSMGLAGGWPLNVFTMPDQKPFYGGTYFRPGAWLGILKNIEKAFREQRLQLTESAEGFARSLAATDTEKYDLVGGELHAGKHSIETMIRQLTGQLDMKEGGLQRSPKFPNPSIWRFMLTAHHILHDQSILDHVLFTLHKMAAGGIYDQVGGGFARYSVDDRWFAPHFEKMLYDNAQLMSLYSNAYQVQKEDRFREVVYETAAFINREMTNAEGGFYSALDADSEGEEGKYYVWQQSELQDLLGSDSDLVCRYYNVTEEGNWEQRLNILHTSLSVEEFAKEEKLDVTKVSAIIDRSKAILLKEREKRVRPGLDDKILTSWNALMIKGFIDAYHAFQEPGFLAYANKNADFIINKLFNGKILYRTLPNEVEVIPGYLDDYAFTIDALYSLYQATFEHKWLDVALKLTDYAIANFFDPAEDLFHFTDKESESLIARKKEIFDNVIPSSNSAMAQSLYFLGHLLERNDYLDMCRSMLAKVVLMAIKNPQYLSNWATLLSLYSKPIAEIAVVGKEHKIFAQEINSHFIPNKVLAAAGQAGGLPLLEHRKAIDGKTTIYVCYNKSCKLPVHSVSEALKQLQSDGG